MGMDTYLYKVKGLTTAEDARNEAVVITFAKEQIAPLESLLGYKVNAEPQAFIDCDRIEREHNVSITSINDWDEETDLLSLSVVWGSAMSTLVVKQRDYLKPGPRMQAYLLLEELAYQRKPFRFGSRNVVVTRTSLPEIVLTAENFDGCDQEAVVKIFGDQAMKDTVLVILSSEYEKVQALAPLSNNPEWWETVALRMQDNPDELLYLCW